MQAAPLFSIDEDSFADSFDSHKNQSEFAMESPTLLSVNQLLESVCWPLSLGLICLHNTKDLIV